MTSRERFEDAFLAVGLPADRYQHALYLWQEAERQTLERCAETIPTNWCDPLLTGDKAALPQPGKPVTNQHIESLLNGIRHRIEAMMQEDEG